MRIKICGLFRNEDIDYVNEARPDYAGFVFAKSSRHVSAVLAQHLRFRLANSIVPVGVFADAPVKEIADIYQKGIISIAQLHGNEDEAYIARLKKMTGIGTSKPIQIIKTINFSAANNRKQSQLKKANQITDLPGLCGSWLNSSVDMLLLDSGAGSGKSFNWNLLKNVKIEKPWFLAGGINLKNIGQAMTHNPFALDVSSGAETNGVKDRSKILKLISIVKPSGNIQVDWTMQEENYRKKLSWSSK